LAKWGWQIKGSCRIPSGIGGGLHGYPPFDSMLLPFGQGVARPRLVPIILDELFVLVFIIDFSNFFSFIYKMYFVIVEPLSIFGGFERTLLQESLFGF